jgi:hypothetical protein
MPALQQVRLQDSASDGIETPTQRPVGFSGVLLLGHLAGAPQKWVERPFSIGAVYFSLGEPLSQIPASNPEKAAYFGYSDLVSKGASSKHASVALKPELLRPS